MAGHWVSSRCLNTEGFPKVLHATLQHLGVQDRPEYEGREYEELGTPRCEVTVYIGKSEKFREIEISQGWSVTATGFRFADTYQIVARKALRRLCWIYGDLMGRTPMRFFPPEEKDQQAWRARMETLQGRDLQENNPMVVHTATYLLALDDQYDRQTSELKKCIRRAQEAEVFSRILQLQLADAHAKLADVERNLVATEEAWAATEDCHVEALKEAYLVTREKRRGSAAEEEEPVVLEGIPIATPRRRRIDFVVPPAPPPTEATDLEPVLSLTQPLPQDEAGPSSKQ
jgi:hypothetical protein